LPDGSERVFGFGKIVEVFDGSFGCPFAAAKAGLHTDDEPVVDETVIDETVVKGAVFRILVCFLHFFVEVSDHALCDRGVSIVGAFPLADIFDQGFDGVVPFLGDGVKEGASVAAADEPHTYTLAACKYPRSVSALTGPALLGWCRQLVG
jgi:hypothetical protein